MRTSVSFFNVLEMHLVMAESGCNMRLKSTEKCMYCIILQKQEAVLIGVTS